MNTFEGPLLLMFRNGCNKVTCTACVWNAKQSLYSKNGLDCKTENI